MGVACNRPPNLEVSKQLKFEMKLIFQPQLPCFPLINRNYVEENQMLLQSLSLCFFFQLFLFTTYGLTGKTRKSILKHTYVIQIYWRCLFCSLNSWGPNPNQICTPKGFSHVFYQEVWRRQSRKVLPKHIYALRIYLLYVFCSPNSWRRNPKWICTPIGFSHVKVVLEKRQAIQWPFKPTDTRKVHTDALHRQMQCFSLLHSQQITGKVQSPPLPVSFTIPATLRPVTYASWKQPPFSADNSLVKWGLPLLAELSPLIRCLPISSSMRLCKTLLPLQALGEGPLHKRQLQNKFPKTFPFLNTPPLSLKKPHFFNLKKLRGTDLLISPPPAPIRCQN